MSRHGGWFGLNRALFLLVVTLLLSCSSGSILLQRRDFFGARSADVKTTFEDAFPPIISVTQLKVTPEENRRIAGAFASQDPALKLYRDPETREMVVDYFCQITGSEEVALSILYHADHLDVPVLLAFSLAWVESRYVPVAVNVNQTSVDRGIFQLNSITFPYLTTLDFFHPDTNIAFGMQHLSWCLSVTSSWRTALAAYNAGLSTVIANDLPSSTISYVNRIMGYEQGLANDFRSYIQSRTQNVTG